ncbi:MAG: alkaline phosphatase [Deltaproteobacteria bacterium]|nr:alkaline phosphatase [Deltaproteobacteria bacterium]
MQKRLKIGAVIVAVFFALIIWLPQHVLAAGPKNVIFYIGDGMASSQRMIPELVYERKLVMNTLPVVGIYTTYSLKTIVTVSAAAGTALATGHKTKNRYISLGPKKKIAYESLAEAAKRMGKSVGIVTTTRITHATPACFGAHTGNRDFKNKIADQYVAKDFEVWMGGGRRHFIPKTAANRQDPDKKMKSKRRDERDLLREFADKGYTILRTKSDLLGMTIEKDTKVFAAFTYSHLDYYLDMPEEVPNLAQMTKAALKILKQNPNGFFLMVEGGRIDHAAHANAPGATVTDTLDLDNAVKLGVDFVQTNPDTLLLVGGDHETGGMSMGIQTGYYMKPEVIKGAAKTVIAMGYGEVLKTPEKAVEIFKANSGITDLTEEEIEQIEEAARQTKAGKTYKSPNKTYNPGWFGFAFANIMSKRARIGWTAYVHTGHPVLITAMGPGSETFEGFFDNTDVAKKVAGLWGVTLKTWPHVRARKKK